MVWQRILIYTNHFYPEQFKINEIVEWLSFEDTQVRVITGLPNYPSGNFIKNYKNIYKTNVTINRLLLIPRGGSNIMLIANYFHILFHAFFLQFISQYLKKSMK